MGRRRKKGHKISGWINLDKPAGMSSTAAVNKVRYLLNAQKAGHAGTLDPLATGILPIALGEATKTIPFCQDKIKAYSFAIVWGAETTTADAEGEITETSDHRPLQSDIEAALPHFVGSIEQIPPRFSAIKIDGQRAYDLARKGEMPEMKARTVQIESLELKEATDELARFYCVCGKGTYIRSLGRDLARHLGTRGHIIDLRREFVGPFTLENAISLAKIEEMTHSAAPEEVPIGLLLPVETALDDIPALKLDKSEATRLRHGQTLSLTSRPLADRVKQSGIDTQDPAQQALAVLDGNPVAIITVSGPTISSDRVFNLTEDKTC